MLLIGLLAASGCASDDEPVKHARITSAPRHPVVPLAGQEIFFDGRILAELQTGAGFGDAGKGDGSGPGGENGHGGGGMHMGSGHGGGGGHHHGGGGGGYGNSPSVSDSIDQDQIANIRRAAANSSPPIVIHLRFTNKGSEHLDLQIADFLSPLGSFVVEPEKLSLDPGQSVEVEPMTSRVASELDQTEVTLTLGLNGHGQKKTVVLKPAPTPPAPAPTTADSAPPVSPPAQ
jgi:hypothetical protein